MVETRCNLKKQSKNVITKRQKRFLHICNTKKNLRRRSKMLGEEGSEEEGEEKSK